MPLIWEVQEMPALEALSWQASLSTALVTLLGLKEEPGFLIPFWPCDPRDI